MWPMELQGMGQRTLDLFYPNAWEVWDLVVQQAFHGKFQHWDDGLPAENLVFHSPLARVMVVLTDIRSYRHLQHEPSSLNGCAGKSSVLWSQERNLSCADRKQIWSFWPTFLNLKQPFSIREDFPTWCS